jgi:hypothetical protein
MGSRLARFATLCFCWMATLFACGGDPLSPEERVRAVIEAMERAAEAGDVSAFKALVSESYQDERGFDKRDLAAYVTFHVMRNTNRHVFTRIRSVEIRESGRAEVVVIAAITGRDVSGPEELVGLNADVYKIDMDLDDEGDGDWRLVWAQWWPTAPTDLL